MFKKNFSMAGKPVLFGFLFVFLVAASFQPAFADPDEKLAFNRNLKLSLNGGLTMTNDAFLDEGAHTNVLIIIRIPWPWPFPDPPWPEFTLEVGYNTFKWDLGAEELNETFYWWNVNPTFRLTFGKSNLKPFISAGPGLYFPKEGDARFGFKGGLGLDYQLSDRFMIEMGADYHYISLGEEYSLIWGDSTDFLHAHAGIVIFL